MADDSSPTQPLLRSGNGGGDCRRSSSDYGAMNRGHRHSSDALEADDGTIPQISRRSDSVVSIIGDHQPATLSWENITVFVKEKGKTAPVVNDGIGVGDAEQDSFSAGNRTPDVSVRDGVKQILKGVTGVVKPGMLLAIMGASGAGKSTLMNVLTNRNVKDYMLEGQIQVNGVAIGSGIRNISAYVQQDDLFIGALTVRETLTFRAMLRMDQSINKEARLERVEEVLVEMGLSKCADTQVGTPGRKKGISGGESKRLSFACEMLMNPPVLFCDEPTSGLDSYMAQNIIQTLQSMAQQNRSILCTIHQPSSEIFTMFDQLLLMSEGRVAYMGPSAQAMEFFRGLGYLCPSNFNPADFYIRTLAIVPGEEQECRKKVNAICDEFSTTQEAIEIKQTVEALSQASSADASLLEEAFSNESRYEASWGQQFVSVLIRSWISVIRDVLLVRVRLVQTLIVALMVGLIYLRQDYNQKGVMNISGAIFIILMQTSFSNMFAVVNTFPQEMPIFLREYGSSLYRTDVYFLSKSLAELPAIVFLPALLITVDYWMIGLYGDAEAYLIATGLIVLVANIAASFGMLISTTAGDVNVALAVAPPLIIPFIMFGGFFLNNDSVPVYFLWLKYLSWFKYANEFMMVNQWEHVSNISCEFNITQCHYFTGQDVLHYYSFSGDNNWFNLGMLFALFIGIRIFAYPFLLLRARRSQR